MVGWQWRRRGAKLQASKLQESREIPRIKFQNRRDGVVGYLRVGKRHAVRLVTLLRAGRVQGPSALVRLPSLRCFDTTGRGDKRAETRRVRPSAQSFDAPRRPALQPWLD